ncbi:hypothetical protein RJ639_010032 [Escallonia herrerae]|uniref:Uncharacterized protein n=1 Tax=Escallonia herrerae TaxID=1293975 RepID=A0AA89ASR3_9ASTE|nr:hypothetical protein RJ639_010032 [Escallonia herrerae]
MELRFQVNNAAISGSNTDWKALGRPSPTYDDIVGENAKKLKDVVKQSYEEAEACPRTNYHGVKLVTTQELVPLLELSDSTRIVNLSSILGQLKLIASDGAKELSRVEDLTEEKVDAVVKGYLEDVKEDSIDSKGWPTIYSSYIVSKAALNAYTRVMAKMYPKIYINAVSPGYVKTDLNNHDGVLTVEEGAKGPVRMALMPDGGPSGLSYDQIEVVGEKPKFKQSYKMAEACLRTNYYGVKLVTRELIALLELSDSPRIINISSTMGQLQLIPNKRAKEELSDVERLTEEKVDTVVKEFLEDLKEGLVNNAGVINGVIDEGEVGYDDTAGEMAKFIRSYKKAEACLRTNYYGVKQVTQELIPLLELSDTPRIVNVSSTMGQLQLIPSKRVKKELGDVEGLTEEKVDAVVKEFLQEVKEGLVESKGWPSSYTAYIVSKAALNAYT